MKKRNLPARGRRGLGARISAKPCSTVLFAPSLGPVLVRGRRGLGARIPAKPCYFVPFAPSLRFVSPHSRPCWRLAPREAIFHRRATPTPAPWPRKTWCSVTKEQGFAGSDAPRPPRRWRLGPGRRGARRRRNKALRGAAHHVRPAAGALAPEDVVLGDEGIRVCGERRTTSDPLPAPWPQKTWCSATKE